MRKKGDPADDADTWFRHATAKRHVTARGTIHHAMFKGSAIGPPADPHQRWRAEVSGRLLSQAGDVAAEGEAAVERGRDKLKAQGKEFGHLKFIGIAYATVAKLRSFTLAATDVVFDPLPEDAAHANLVFLDKDPSAFSGTENALSLLDGLIQLFRFKKVDELSPKPKL
jgi:hypothetical protein